jgi:hypothetical protein
MDGIVATARAPPGETAGDVTVTGPAVRSVGGDTTFDWRMACDDGAP